MAEPKRVLLVYPVDFSDESNRGVYNKMIGQSQGFEELGYIVYQVYLKEHNCILNTPKSTSPYATSKSKKWSKFYSFFNGLIPLLNKQTYDIIYIRHLLHTPALCGFLKAIKNSKAIYEYPTYPYAQEWRSRLQQMLLTMDQKYRSKSEKHIDLVVHYGGYDGPCKHIQITNGVQLLSHIDDKKRNESYVRLVAVGKWASWHGLDRIIKGMVNSDQFRLKIIGDGPELVKLKKQSHSLRLSDKIEFLSPLWGESISTELSNADIGIGTLGLHRKAVLLDSSLKHRLYAAHGLPFILSSEDTGFEKSLPFVHYVEKSDAPVDLLKVLLWYKQLSENGSHRHEFFTYAKAQLGWKNRVSKIISSL